MDEGSDYYGCSSEIESVSDAAKIVNMETTALERDKTCLEKDNVESNIKPRFLADMLGIMGLLEGREREGLTILEDC